MFFLHDFKGGRGVNSGVGYILFPKSFRDINTLVDFPVNCGICGGVSEFLKGCWDNTKDYYTWDFNIFTGTMYLVSKNKKSILDYNLVTSIPVSGPGECNKIQVLN